MTFQTLFSVSYPSRGSLFYHAVPPLPHLILPVPLFPSSLSTTASPETTLPQLLLTSWPQWGFQMKHRCKIQSQYPQRREKVTFVFLDLGCLIPNNCPFHSFGCKLCNLTFLNSSIIFHYANVTHFLYLFTNQGIYRLSPFLD